MSLFEYPELRLTVEAESREAADIIAGIAPEGEVIEAESREVVEDTTTKPVEKIKK